MTENRPSRHIRFYVGVTALVLVMLTPFNIFSKSVTLVYDSTVNVLETPAELPDSLFLTNPVPSGSEVVGEQMLVRADSVKFVAVDSAQILDVGNVSQGETVEKIFNPDPTRAVWLSALFPGLGQIYNRRYWKLPLVVGGFMGLAYGMSWNNGMLRDYTRAYTDLMDNDPSTKSYMDFFPPTTQESNLDRTWLQRILKSRKDYYRRNRDLCIISMVGVYLLAMVDAYVDASLTHFDISPDLSMNVHPAIIPDTRSRIPGLGLHWALNF